MQAKLKKHELNLFELKKLKKHGLNYLQGKKLKKDAFINLFDFASSYKAKKMDLLLCNLRKLKKHEFIFVFFKLKKAQKGCIYFCFCKLTL